MSSPVLRRCRFDGSAWDAVISLDYDLRAGDTLENAVLGRPEKMCRCWGWGKGGMARWDSDTSRGVKLSCGHFMAMFVLICQNPRIRCE